MAGVTSADFRYIVRKYTSTLLYTEMCSAHALVHNPGLECAKLYEWDHPAGIQIYGAKPEIMAKAAVIAEKLGADVVDINMGCARRIITKQGAGAALLRNLGVAKKIVREVRKSISLPLSIKTRIGWEQFDRKIFEEIATWEIDFLTVHGRTARAGFSGKVDYDALREIKEIVSFPVIGNGNIFRAEDAKVMQGHTKCDAVMVARGMMGKPAFPAECIAFMAGHSYQTPDIEKIMEDILSQAQKFCENRGKDTLKKFRQHIYWYFKNFRKPPEFYTKILDVETYPELVEFLDWFSMLCPQSGKRNH
ncbi:MAG: tRNA dihydrouridine synthase [Thermoplasmata archaeon]